jgi:predicted metalloprotease with PDZ domain
VSWQRSEDYYNEGLLIWLETDAIIRERSKGAKSMDDFARAFFGTKEGDYSANPYDFKDLVRTLNGVAAYDWDGFLTKRLTEKASGAPLNGLTQGGYRLIFGDEPTPQFKDGEKRSKEINLSYALGGVIAKGKLTSVIWDGPFFNAGMVIDTEIIAVNGMAYEDDVIKEAITAAKGTTTPIRLIIKNGDRVREVSVPYYGGLRYPKLEKIGTADSGLDMLLKAK